MLARDLCTNNTAVDMSEVEESNTGPDEGASTAPQWSSAASRARYFAGPSAPHTGIFASPTGMLNGQGTAGSNFAPSTSAAEEARGAEVEMDGSSGTGLSIFGFRTILVDQPRFYQKMMRMLLSNPRLFRLRNSKIKREGDDNLEETTPAQRGVGSGHAQVGGPQVGGHAGGIRAKELVSWPCAPHPGGFVGGMRPNVGMGLTCGSETSAFTGRMLPGGGINRMRGSQSAMPQSAISQSPVSQSVISAPAMCPGVGMSMPCGPLGGAFAGGSVLSEGMGLPCGSQAQAVGFIGGMRPGEEISLPSCGAASLPQVGGFSGGMGGMLPGEGMIVPCGPHTGGCSCGMVGGMRPGEGLRWVYHPHQVSVARFGAGH